MKSMRTGEVEVDAFDGTIFDLLAFDVDNDGNLPIEELLLGVAPMWN